MRKYIAFALLALGMTNNSFSQITKPATVSNPNITQVQNAGLINEYARAISNPLLIASYRWWKNTNPGNYEIDPVTLLGRTSFDTGIVNYSKRTQISLVGWSNPLPHAIDDDSLVHLKPLNGLMHIIIGGFTGDQGIQNIASLKNLKTLIFSRTGLPNNNLTDSGMKIISRFFDLEVLEIPPCPRVKTEGYKALGNLTKLKDIRLIEWSVQAKDLSFLAYMKNLKNVDLSNSSVNDDGVAHLAGHPYLEILNLEFDPVTNKSFARFTGITSLKKLIINHTLMDLDSGYQEFKNILLANPSLKHISLYGVKASDETMLRLRNEFPTVAFFK